MILVNSANLSSGGAFTILENFYRYAPRNSTFLIKDESIFNKLKSARADGPEMIIPPAWTQKPWGLFLFYFFWVNRIAEKKGATEILSLGNIAARTSIKQKLYIHWAYFAYGVKAGGAAELSITFKRYVRYSFIDFFSKYASTWIVQTQAMQKKLSIKANKNKSLKIITIYPGCEIQTPSSHAKKTNTETPKNIKLIYPSLYYSHKNFESLIKLAEKIDAVKLPFTISLTLPKEIFETLGFSKYNSVENLGVLTKTELNIQYSTHDALIMPTKLETVGLPYIEAMTHGLPIATSDKDFSRDICGDYAIYFDPENCESIISAIKKLKGLKESDWDFSAKSQRQLSKFPTWQKSVSSVFS